MAKKASASVSCRSRASTRCRKAAELLRRTHAGGELLRVSGHPEVELALARLHEATGEPAWLELAASFIEIARRINTSWSIAWKALITAGRRCC